MAPAKRKRRSKHRGTAAGTIETRGRTGRPPTADEKKRQARETARDKRLNTAPTWSRSIKNALLAAGFMFIFLVVVFRPKHGSPILPALVTSIFALLLYVPASYYLDGFLFRRRMAKQGKPLPGGKK
ncbi:MAG TPA: hypothetical protein VGI50_05255 [Solirubrobacteraceae bacterium]|jgi:Flp pilus assembly protein TadB